VQPVRWPVIKNNQVTRMVIQYEAGVDKKVEFEYLSKDEILQIN